jgi:hypothetical protein
LVTKEAGDTVTIVVTLRLLFPSPRQEPFQSRSPSLEGSSCLRHPTRHHTFASCTARSIIPRFSPKRRSICLVPQPAHDGHDRSSIGGFSSSAPNGENTDGNARIPAGLGHDLPEAASEISGQANGVPEGW